MAKTITANGNAQVDTTTKKFGTGALTCDGSGDYITTPDHADFNFGSGDFTIECWVYRNNVTGTIQAIMGQITSGGDDQNYMRFNADNRVRWLWHHSLDTIAVTSGGTVTDDSAWHHLAFVRYGNDLKIYIDGTADGTGDVTGLSLADPTSSFSVGRCGDWATWYINSNFDEIRVSNTARYTGNFTPSTSAFTYDSNTKLLIHCDGADESTTFTDDTGDVATNMKLNVGDAWKTVKAAKLNVGDTWKAVAKAKVNVDDTWKTVF